MNTIKRMAMRLFFTKFRQMPENCRWYFGTVSDSFPKHGKARPTDAKVFKIFFYAGTLEFISSISPAGAIPDKVL